MTDNRKFPPGNQETFLGMPPDVVHWMTGIEAPRFRPHPIRHLDHDPGGPWLPHRKLLWKLFLKVSTPGNSVSHGMRGLQTKVS